MTTTPSDKKTWNNLSTEQLLAKIALYVFLSFIILSIIFGTFYTIEAGERGILLTFKKPDLNSKEPGLHYKIPIVQSVIKMNVQIQRFDIDKASAASSDLQIVTTNITVNYFISPDDVSDVYTNIGKDYQHKIITPAVQEVLKSVTATHTAEELITQRPIAKEAIDLKLKERLAPYNIIIQDVSITDFQFSPEFEKSVELKVTAEQNAFTAKNVLEQKKYEAQQLVVTAQAQADSQALLSKAVNSQTLEYQKLLNEKAAIDQWDGHLPIYFGGNSMPFIDITNLKSQRVINDGGA